jgi:hypothetical protein
MNALTTTSPNPIDDLPAVTWAEAIERSRSGLHLTAAQQPTRRSNLDET